MTTSMGDLYHAEAHAAAVQVLENEPCSSDPELYAKHLASLTRDIQKAILNWFDTPGDQE